MKRWILLSCLGVGLAAIPVSVAITYSTARNAEGSINQLRSNEIRVSNAGTPLAYRAGTSVIDHLNPRSLYVMGTLGRTSFYRFERVPSGKGGSPYCWAVGSSVAAAASIGGVYCTNDFPSSDFPILDVSTVQGASRTEKTVRLLKVAGFAVDGVDRINIVDKSGKTVGTVPVVKNMYEMEHAPPAVGGSLNAVDHEGTILYTIRY